MTPIIYSKIIFLPQFFIVLIYKFSGKISVQNFSYNLIDKTSEKKLIDIRKKLKIDNLATMTVIVFEV